MTGLTYDTGALLAAERGSRSMWTRHEQVLARGGFPTVPATVLAQAWRGGSRQANLARLLSACTVDDLDEPAARATGIIAGLAGHSDIVDASVVEGAARRGDVVITSDVADIRRVAAAAGVRLVVRGV